MANVTQQALKKVMDDSKLQGYSKEVGHPEIKGSPEKFIPKENKKGDHNEPESPKGAGLKNSKQGGVKAPVKGREMAVPKAIAQSAKSKGSLQDKAEKYHKAMSGSKK